MKAIILFLITAYLLLTGCGGGGGGGSSGGSSSPEPLLNTTADGGGDGSGGGGDGNNGGGGGNGNGSNGDGGDERPSLPAEVELSISPFIDGLRIQWHNLSAIEGAGGIYIHLNLTGGNPPQPDERKIAIEDFSDDSYEIDGLDNGTAYRLVGVRVEQANNTFWVIDNITWSEPWQAKTNALDNNGNGIVVGANHDGDGQADWVDTDDDNDGRPDNRDTCRLGEIGWSSDNTTLDYDGDGCRNDEDPDGDNDGILNVDEEVGCELKIDCDDDGVDDINEVMGCAMNPNCDSDDLDDGEDSCPAGQEGWSNDGTNDMDSDGCRNDEDIDDDGDGLIEIGMAEELDAVRWVLNGMGFKANEEAALDQSGCGNSSAIRDCIGYELVGNISLSNHIARTNATAGWQPIASDTDGSRAGCQGGSFTAIFDGNGFVISGLFINRSMEDCIGLFGHAARGTIRHLGVVADKVEGRQSVGGLVGDGDSASIVQSYAVSNSVSGSGLSSIGGLVGAGDSISIVQSYAVSGLVNGSHNSVGGLLGGSNSASIVQSYAVSNSVVSGGSFVGGLVGTGHTASIVQSYAVSGGVRGNHFVGGLVGLGLSASMVQSYAVSGEVSAAGNVGGLMGHAANVNVSYWDTETSEIASGGAGSGQTRDTLRSPTGYTGIYAIWDDGAINEETTIAGVDHNGTIWCDEDASGMIEDDERRGDGDANGDNRIWDFGTSSDYPALRCTGDSLEDQRAWWYLNATNKPQLNQTYLDAYLGG